MSRFMPGDACVIRDAKCLGHAGKPHIGEDVIIHFQVPPEHVPPQFLIHPAGDDAPFYAVSLGDGIRSVLCGHCLTRKPDDSNTWAGITALTGWAPPAALPVQPAHAGGAA